jgi:thiol-disulfide isomerase/thioredoxin
LGKPTAVVFWLNTCPHCRKALPLINRLPAQLGPGKQVVTAAIDARLKGPKGFAAPVAAARTLRLTLLTILVAKDVARTQWRVAVTPTAYIMSSGRVITHVLQSDSPQTRAGDIKTALAQTN